MLRADRAEKFQNWKRTNAPYLIAMALAFVMVMIIAPEMQEGNAMKPTLNDGDVLVVTKSSYAPNRTVPERDKLIIMEKTLEQDVTNDNIIARVVGLPGETVEIKDGKVYIDGKEHVTDESVGETVGEMKITLGEREVFLLCDNREELTDSRNEGLGPVDMAEIKGNVFFRVWPLSNFGGVE